jgi:hypothetical protein
MRTITFIGTIGAALTATMLFAATANADRVCRRVCDDGFCQTRCFNSGDRVYRYDRDRDHYRDRDYDRRPGFGLHVPGLGIELGR